MLVNSYLGEKLARKRIRRYKHIALYFLFTTEGDTCISTPPLAVCDSEFQFLHNPFVIGAFMYSCCFLLWQLLYCIFLVLHIFFICHLYTKKKTPPCMCFLFFSAFSVLFFSNTTISGYCFTLKYLYIVYHIVTCW